MLTIKILGIGCPNCNRLEAVTRQAIEMAGLEAELEKVTDYVDIMAFKVLSTPGLVINEKVYSSGRIPGPEEIVSWLVGEIATIE